MSYPFYDQDDVKGTTLSTTSTTTSSYDFDTYDFESSSGINTILAIIIALPIALTLCCVACGVVIGVVCCRRCKKTTNHGTILSLPTTVPEQGHNGPNHPANHNVSDDPAPAYEALQIDRSNPPSYEASNRKSGNEGNDDHEYDYIPTDESEMPTRGQRANNRPRSPAPLPKPARGIDHPEPSRLQTSLPEQYLTVSGQGTSDGSGTDNEVYLEPTGPSGNAVAYVAISENTDGYLAPTGNTDGYLAPTGNTDGYLAPTGNTDGYLAPTGNTDGLSLSDRNN